MLLHETRNDDGIRAFFTDVWECYVKTILNPFYAVDNPIKSSVFESRVRAIAKVVIPWFANEALLVISLASLPTLPLTKSLNVILSEEFIDGI